MARFKVEELGDFSLYLYGKWKKDEDERGLLVYASEIFEVDPDMGEIKIRKKDESVFGVIKHMFGDAFQMEPVAAIQYVGPQWRATKTQIRTVGPGEGILLQERNETNKNDPRAIPDLPFVRLRYLEKHE